MHTGDVGLFAGFDLCVYRIDDVALFVFFPGKVPKDAKAMDYAAGR